MAKEIVGDFRPDQSPNIFNPHSLHLSRAFQNINGNVVYGHSALLNIVGAEFSEMVQRFDKITAHHLVVCPFFFVFNCLTYFSVILQLKRAFKKIGTILIPN